MIWYVKGPITNHPCALWRVQCALWPNCIEFCELVLPPLPLGGNLSSQACKILGDVLPKVVRYTYISLIYHFGAFQTFGIFSFKFITKSLWGLHI